MQIEPKILIVSAGIADRSCPTCHRALSARPDDSAVERVARCLAPRLEGGRDYDQMPPDRVTLKAWHRQGMCSINDATQEDAIEAARAAIAALGDSGSTGTPSHQDHPLIDT